MTNTTSIELIRIITSFLTENSVIILLLTLLIICRDSISSFISRLTSLSYKNGASEVGVSAAAPHSPTEKSTIDLQNADEKPLKQSEEAEIEDKTKEKSWFSEMYKAFEDGELILAEQIFKKYALEEEDSSKLEENKALYLFFKFELGKDNSAIKQLEELARNAKTDESKVSCSTWFSFYLSDSMQYKKEIALWQRVKNEVKSEPQVTKAIIYLAYALNKDNQASDARELLIARLSMTDDGEQKSEIFEALSKIEESLGNKTISVYCKDKSLEFDPDNRDELFNSAYSASNENIDAIAIGNYLRLLRIDGDNPTALNNLGVRAQEAGLKTKAIDYYKKSAKNKNTLAMANQGYLLLEAGFTDEAEQIANSALELEDTHQNVYSLITAIHKKKDEQKKEWERLSEKSLAHQKSIREYIEKHYLGEPKELEGNWFARGRFPVTITITDNKLDASWEEPIQSNNGTYSASLTGTVSGASFSGVYSRKPNKEKANSLLGLGIATTSNACIGFISDNKENFTLISPKLNDDFSLCFSKNRSLTGHE